MQAIAESTFALVANGAPEHPPVDGLLAHLLEREARRVVVVYHPLSPHDAPEHRVQRYERGALVDERLIRLPSKPPLTYPLDLAVPASVGRVDLWFGFNNLAAARGLAERAVRRVGKVVYWTIDFVPDRFGPGVLTRAYDAVDKFCCRRVDARWEVTGASLEARNARLGLPSDDKTRVMPMGIFLDRVPPAPEDGWRARRVLYTGGLVERQGVALFVDALAELQRRGVELTADIGGKGPLEAALREKVASARLDDVVTFHGFLPDHKDVEALLASGSIGVAPYDPTIESFSRFADPSKIKSYLAAGLPVLTTDVTPEAGDFAVHGGAEIVPFEASAWADAIERALDDPTRWTERRNAALAYARRYDWPEVLTQPLAELGFSDR